MSPPRAPFFSLEKAYASSVSSHFRDHFHGLLFRNYADEGLEWVFAEACCWYGSIREGPKKEHARNRGRTALTRETRQRAITPNKSRCRCPHFCLHADARP